MKEELKLEALRSLMREHPSGPLHAYIVPSEDFHLSEYVADQDKRREFISGFSGSTGTAVVTGDRALLYVDGRYYLQAAQQLSAAWTVMRMGEDAPLEKWLAENLPAGSSVGVDGRCVSVDMARRLSSALEKGGSGRGRGHALVWMSQSLVDEMWIDRPRATHAPVRVHGLEFAGRSAQEKLAELRMNLAQEKAHAIIITALDEIAWLLNIRGADVACNPVVHAFAVVTAAEAVLYVDPAKITGSVAEYLDSIPVRVKDYDLILSDIAELVAVCEGIFFLAQQQQQQSEGDALGSVDAATAMKGLEKEGNNNNNNDKTDGAPTTIVDKEEDGNKGSGSGGSSSISRLFMLWIDPAACNYAVYSRIPATLALQQQSPLQLSKALKNPVELEGFRNSHIRDGVALVSFIIWLDQQMQRLHKSSGYFGPPSEEPGRKRRRMSRGRAHSDAAADAAARAGGGASESGDGNYGEDANNNNNNNNNGGEEDKATARLTEVSVAEKLEDLRKKQQHFMGLSFPTISSCGPNAAVIHYQPQPDSCRELDATQIYLCDSGAQYLDGTTDVTRTLHFGEPTREERAAATQVLKGYLALARTIFPNGTTGNILDALARAPLWAYGLDYRHGTGHGVGSYLNVHEGPHLISFRPKARNIPLTASMTVTIEPGYYQDGAFGVRVENVMIVKEVECPNNFGGKGFLGFETVTMAPLQVKLIDLRMITKEEKECINDYHRLVREKLSPYFSGSHLEWLQRATEPLPS